MNGIIKVLLNFMETEIRERLERFKIKAEEFVKEDIRAFIVDVNDTYYFCDILFVGEVYLTIQNFEGEKAGQNNKLYWTDIVKLEEYKSREKNNTL